MEREPLCKFHFKCFDRKGFLPKFKLGPWIGSSSNSAALDLYPKRQNWLYRLINAAYLRNEAKSLHIRILDTSEQSPDKVAEILTSLLAI